jgi:putative membrane protein
MDKVISLIISSLAVFITGYILPGVHIATFFTAFVIAVVLGLVNTFIRPLIFILTLPINILTLGLFTFVIIGGLVMLVSAIVPGFYVDNFLWAIAFAIVLTIVNGFLHSLRRK